MHNLIINNLKAISKACNSSFNFEQFIVNLDLINITLDEAEKLYEDNCKDIIKHMSPFWCKDGKFKFYKVFDEVQNFCYANYRIKRFALPYRLCSGFDINYYNKRLMLHSVNSFGEDIVMGLSQDLLEDMQAMHGIDVFHECFL